ncbi:ATP-binding protein [Thermococcus argininiproducens]|uniref:ATP-binding protein n=1 Tax=Thermococcus argininiproducens TaxID=2866384 RepID=A0A9E7M8H7_9EURY|nr:ATP-binding protein [Thermococcus argininiproducens]USG99386.1 ATP-binding protein [Thermococcus argininiproducens]
MSENNVSHLRIGFVLSGSTTSTAKIQLTQEGEERVFEGMLVVISSKRRKIEYLGRIDSIKPVNEFYREGDPWSEARKKGIPLDAIGDVGRSYVLSEVSLLGTLGNSGLRDVRYPPEPGDKVYMINDGEGYEKKIFGIERGESGYIWYGNIIGYKQIALPLNIENITMHLGIFGVTGSGKSYGLGYLLELLSKIPYVLPDSSTTYLALPTIVIDANGDYLDYHEHFLDSGLIGIGKFRNIYRMVFRKSKALGRPFTKGITIDLDVFNTRELAEFIISYKTAGKEINELQVAGLELALKELEYDSFTNLFTENFENLKYKLDELSTGRDAPIHSSTRRAIASALEKFKSDVIERDKLVTKSPQINVEFIEQITKEPSLVIFDFSAEGAPGVSPLEKQLVIAYLSRLLYNKFTEYKNRGEDRYLLFIIEECQNYIPNTSNYPVHATLTRDYLSLIATQGRKFGICLGLVSQRPAFVDPVVVSMLNTYIIHRVSPDDATYIRKISGGLPKSLENRLTTLERGKAIVVGQMNPLGYPVLVEVGRRSIEHKMGKTNVMDGLYTLFKSK